MSVVTRVTRRPTGLRSKILNIQLLQMRHQIARRRSNIAFWPVHCIR